jgi:hypothetical protein
MADTPLLPTLMGVIRRTARTIQGHSSARSVRDRGRRGQCDIFGLQEASFLTGNVLEADGDAAFEQRPQAYYGCNGGRDRLTLEIHGHSSGNSSARPQALFRALALPRSAGRFPRMWGRRQRKK